MSILKEILEQFKNPELLAILAVIIIFLVLLRALSDALSRHKFLKIILIGSIVILFTLGVFWIIENRRELYSNSSKKYVYGNVQSISKELRRIDLYVTNSNVLDEKYNKLEGTAVLVKIDINCKFVDNFGNEISFNDINMHDTLKISVKQKNVKDSSETLSGIKVIQKRKSSY